MPGGEVFGGFACTVCGERHDVLPLKYSIQAPQAVVAVPPDQLQDRVVLTADQCVIDGQQFFLRGRILIPVHGLDAPFVWGVWAEVSPKAFLRANDLWNTLGREQEPPFSGWLNNEIFLFGDTLNLQVDIHTQAVGERPRFTVSDPAHPLAVQQQTGITIETIQDIAEMIMHRGQSGAE
ncbi:DUF2199 domain-containing protein [Edaphobacter sp. HDX4]|uniref:DUF2199 domain-containing protein n=1 Tax=Edaphobacter sp. HDX4 TaxID=2794064 RepID=UPI002FE63C11